MEQPMRLAVLGAGKMGGILIEAFVKQKLVAPANIFATVQHASEERKSGTKLSVTLGRDNRAAVKKADVILLCVKPQTVGQVVDENHALRREFSIKEEKRGKRNVVTINISIQQALDQYFAGYPDVLTLSTAYVFFSARRSAPIYSAPKRFVDRASTRRT